MKLRTARAKSTVIVLCTVLVLTTFQGIASVRASSLWIDTFSDGNSNGYLNRWDPWQFGVGNPTTGSVVVDVGHNRLLMTVTGGAANGGQTCGYGITLKDSVGNLQGNFIMQVHYELLSWNLDNPYCRCGLGDTRPVSEDSWMWGERISESPHYGVDAHLNGAYDAIVNNQGTTATSGDIRLVRVSNVVTEYYKDSTVSDWTASGYSDQGTGNLSPELGFWVWYPGQSFSGGPYEIAFSNFEIVSGTFFVVPEYAFGAILAVAACFAAFAVIKRPKINLKHK